MSKTKIVKFNPKQIQEAFREKITQFTKQEFSKVMEREELQTLINSPKSS